MPASADTGLSGRLLEFSDALRAEGVALGTSELLDAVAALDHVQWGEPRQCRGALATTLAKSQEDRRVFDLVFDRFCFRAAEMAAVREGVTEGGGMDAEGAE